MTSKASPSPISVSTSQAWDNDGAGLWSTFALNVGAPAQTVRVMASTAGWETWVVVNQGCPASYGAACAFNRGGLFGIGNSTSWTNINLFQLDLELNLGYSGNGQFGYDTVTLGYPNSGGPTLTKQIVAGIATPDFWLGQFGLDPAPANFTNLNDPQPSFLWTLRNQSMIPSTSWGYTAGAHYRYDKVQGSLTLGGYDSSRFSSKNLTYPMYNDNQRRYLAELRTISYIPTGLSTQTTSTTLMSQTISMYIDSTIPYIYLPKDACDRIESAFGLQWNTTSELYTLNSTQHTTLQNMNPNITFTLGTSGGATLDFILPYKAFDLTATFPVLAAGVNNTNYFPLKRAANETQYTLGRAFLQEAYMIADYDRHTFTLSPAVWPASFDSKIVAILPPSTNNTNTTISITTHKSETPIGAVVGGVVGGIVVLVLLATAYWHFIWKPKHKKPISKEESVDTDLPPSTVTQAATIATEHSELDGHFHGAELTAYQEAEKKRLAGAEIAGTPILGHELDSQVPVGSELDSPQIFEMPAREPVGNEMHSPGSSPRLSPGVMSRGRRSPLSRDVSRETSRDGVRRVDLHETYYHP